MCVSSTHMSLFHWSNPFHVIKFITYYNVALCIFRIMFQNESHCAMWNHQAFGKYSWIKLTWMIDKILITVKLVKGKYLTANIEFWTSWSCIKWSSAFFMGRSFRVCAPSEVVWGWRGGPYLIKICLYVVVISEKVGKYVFVHGLINDLQKLFNRNGKGFLCWIARPFIVHWC